jgi:hypothetical protein
VHACLEHRSGALDSECLALKSTGEIQTACYMLADLQKYSGRRVSSAIKQ